MSDNDQSSRDAENEPAKVKPEEQGHAVPGTGAGIEPEALHPATGSAMSTADKMWGPPGPSPNDGE